MTIARVRIAIYGETRNTEEFHKRIMNSRIPLQNEKPSGLFRLDLARILEDTSDTEPPPVDRYNPPMEGEFGSEAGFHFEMDPWASVSLARRLSGLFPNLAFVVTFSFPTNDYHVGVGFLQGREVDRLGFTIHSNGYEAKSWPRTSFSRFLNGIEQDLAHRMTEIIKT